MASSSRTQLQPLTGEQQEHIIKQRMQVDERSLRRLVKKLTLLLGSTCAESVSTARLSFQADLEAFRLQLLRLSSIARGTCEVEIASYTQELSEIEQEQARTRDRIAALKQRLEDVRRERQNKLEYDTVAAEIVTLPTRAELNESLTRLGEQLQSVRAERAKYVDMSRDAAARMGVVMRDVEALRNDVGYEVGERERREVERADGDADAEAGDDASESGRKQGKAEAGDEPEEGEQSEHDDSANAMRSGSSTPRGDALAVLNPSAPTFRPTAGGGATTAARRKRDSTAVTASDEEGEVGDGSSAAAASNSNTPRKRQRTEEGEVAGADSEEEEGSIQPAASAASESAGRSRAGTKRRR